MAKDDLIEALAAEDEGIWWHDGCWASWCTHHPDTCKPVKAS